MELLRNFCVVLFKVTESMLKLMPNLSLKSCGVISECHSELEHMFESGTSDLTESNWLSRTKTFGSLTSRSDIATFVDAIFWWIRFKSNKHSKSSSSYWCRPRVATELTYFIEPTTAWRILLLCWNQTSFVFQFYGDDNIIWGNFYKLVFSSIMGIGIQDGAVHHKFHEKLIVLCDYW